MKRKPFALCLLAILVVVLPLLGQITIGLTAAGAAGAGGVPVHDSIQTTNASIERALIVAKQVAHIAATVYQTGYTVKHFNFYVAQTMQIPYKSWRWAIEWLATRPTPVTADTYGSNGGWINKLDAVNRGISAVDTYINHVERMTYPSPYIGIAGLDRLQNRLSAIELGDSGNARMIGIISDLRYNEANTQVKIANLREDSFDESDTRNTTTAVLQKTNAATLLSLQLLSDQNQLISSELQRKLASDTADRDEEVRAANLRIWAFSNAAPFAAGEAANTTAGLNSLDVP